jgi:predicted acyltransferase
MSADHATTTQTSSAQRLMSLDALRGFDMFWIIGANALVYALSRIADGLRNKAVESDSLLYRCVRFLATQLEHVDWEGFRFYDLIFPLFVFMVGASTVFSLTRMIEKEGRAAAIKRVIRRGILLFIIGIFYSGGFTNPWPDMRLMGVLNRIALAYMFGGLLFCFFKPRALVAICAGILVGYWALMTFVPIRDIQLTRENIARLAEESGDEKTATYYRNRNSPNPSAVKNSPAWAAAQSLFYATTNRVSGKFAKGHNVSDHFDFQYLPGMKYDTFFDPEGILSTIPAIATCLLGIFAGLLLQNSTVPQMRKVSLLIGAGVAAAIAGWLWNFQFPVVKKIWTSSYVLVAGGYSAMFMGVFYLIVDVWKYQKWCQPFVWIGMNSITIYLTANFLGSGGFRRLSTRLVGGDIKTFFDTRVTDGFGDLIVALVGLALAIWFVHFLYKRKIFLRL